MHQKIPLGLAPLDDLAFLNSQEIRGSLSRIPLVRSIEQVLEGSKSQIWCMNLYGYEMSLTYVAYVRNIKNISDDLQAIPVANIIKVDAENQSVYVCIEAMNKQIRVGVNLFYDPSKM